MRAVYDEIADWYEHEFLGTQDTRAADPLGIEPLPARPARPGQRSLPGDWLRDRRARRNRRANWAGRRWGWTCPPGMLRHARGRLAIARADAQRLPVRDDVLPAVISVMAHTDMPGYLAVVSEAARVLRPGGALVHVGVHPCFCGGFADRSDPQAIVIRPRLPRQALDEGIVDGQGRPRQGRRRSLPAPPPSARLHRGRTGPRPLRRGRYPHAAGARHPGPQARRAIARRHRNSFAAGREPLV